MFDMAQIETKLDNLRVLVSEAAISRARIEEKLDNVVLQTTKTNGNVAVLFERTNANALDVALAAKSILRLQSAEKKWGERIWKLIMSVGLLAAGYALAAIK